MLASFKFTVSFILFSLATISALIGTLLIMRADKKAIKTVTETPGDILGPLLIKDYKIDPRLIAKRKFYDPHNRKMKRLRNFGIFLLILVPVFTIAALIFQE